jgi:hypothetical protein
VVALYWVFSRFGQLSRKTAPNPCIQRTEREQWSSKNVYLAHSLYAAADTSPLSVRSSEMDSLAHWYSLYVAWVTIPLFGAISIVFHVKRRTVPTLFLCIGLCLVTLGSLIQVFAGAGAATFDEFGNILSSSGPTIFWYLGSVFSRVNSATLLRPLMFTLDSDRYQWLC